MVRDPYHRRDRPIPESVVDALDDSDCRAIIKQLEYPMTANEVANRCDIPLSTTYRKLDKLSESTLLEELTEIRTDGRHTTRYRIDFREVCLLLDDDRSFGITITRPKRPADERLADLWAEVRKGI